MLALRNEERTLRQSVFFSELEEREHLAFLFISDKPLNETHQLSPTLPAGYIELCSEITRHLGGQEGSTNSHATAAGRKEHPAISYPDDPSPAGLTLPSRAPVVSPGSREVCGENVPGPDLQARLDERISFLCDQKYGAFQADRRDAQNVATSVLLRDKIVW